MKQAERNMGYSVSQNFWPRATVNHCSCMWTRPPTHIFKACSEPHLLTWAPHPQHLVCSSVLSFSVLYRPIVCAITPLGGAWFQRIIQNSGTVPGGVLHPFQFFSNKHTLIFIKWVYCFHTDFQIVPMLLFPRPTILSSSFSDKYTLHFPRIPEPSGRGGSPSYRQPLLLSVHRTLPGFSIYDLWPSCGHCWIMYLLKERSPSQLIHIFHSCFLSFLYLSPTWTILLSAYFVQNTI